MGCFNRILIIIQKIIQIRAVFTKETTEQCTYSLSHRSRGLSAKIRRCQRFAKFFSIVYSTRKSQRVIFSTWNDSKANCSLCSVFSELVPAISAPLNYDLNACVTVRKPWICGFVHFSMNSKFDRSHAQHHMTCCFWCNL